MRESSAVSKLERFKMSRLWRYFIWIALGSNLVWYLSGFTWPYYWVVLTSLLGPLTVCLFRSRSAGAVADCLCGSGRVDISGQDRLAREINQIRFLKRQGKFEKALAVVNDVLDQAPNFPEALYLKAHVLWEGYKNPWAAESYFRKVVELTEARDPVHRWASSCLLSPRINGRS